MTKLTWTIAAFLILAGLTSVYFNRSANKELLPYLGKWTGSFAVDKVAGKQNPALAKRSSLTGYLQLYGAKNRFEMRLSGEQQDVTVKGTWALEKETRLVLNPAEVAIEDYGGASQRDPNLVYIPNDRVRLAYQKPIVLDLSPDRQRLEGLLTSIGDLTGHHEFVRVGSGR